MPGGKCPECGLEVGGSTNVDPYKHAISCLHLIPGERDKMIRAAEEESPERGERTRILMGYTMDAPKPSDEPGA